jgi:hypothetical protein
MAMLTMVEAINLALKQEMERIHGADPGRRCGPEWRCVSG